MNKNLVGITGASIAGILFAGYLTFTKMILGYCPLTEPCPFLWGYPVCVYGLIFFIALLISALTLNVLPKDVIAKNMLKYISVISVLFALYFMYQEIFVITCLGGCKYSLGVPTCVYGLIFYLIILYNSFKYK